MKAIIPSLVLPLVLASTVSIKAQTTHPAYGAESNNGLIQFRDRMEENRTFQIFGTQLSGYSFHPIFCDSQVVESFDLSTQAFIATSATKMAYDTFMRPVMRKAYRNLSINANDTNTLRFSYGPQDRIVEIRKNSDELTTFGYNAFNDLFVLKAFSRANQQWTEIHSDSIAITYQNNKPFSQELYYRDVSAPVYYAHTRNMNLAFDTIKRIQQYLWHQIEWPNLNWLNHFYAFHNLEWEMGYPTNHILFDNRPNHLGYLVTLPHNWYAQLPEPTKGDFYRVEGLVFSLDRRLLNSGWQNNTLKITEQFRVSSTGAFDTSNQRLYEHDHLDRLIYYQVDEKQIIGTNARLWPELAFRWTYDTANRLLSTTKYENMSPQGLWIDSTVTERTYEFTSDPVPKVFRFTDSLTTNGVKRPSLRHTFYYGNFALTTKALLSDQKPNLYPNPTRESFFIEGITNLGLHSTLGIYSALGQLIWQTSLNMEAGDKQEIKLPAIAPGIYHVVLQSVNQRSSHRLIIR